MDHRMKVMILFGGESTEHEISRRSAVSLLTHIDRDKYDVCAVGITREGSWFLTCADLPEIMDGSWERRRDNASLMLSLDRDHPGFFKKDGSGREHLPVDVVFPVLHGKFGEDGTVQGMLRMAGIPFVGSDTKASAACMDKGITKALVEQAEAAVQARCCVLFRSGCDPEEAAEGIEAFFKGGYPLFVKPAASGSSVGISKVGNRQELVRGIEVAFAEDSKILIEEAIVGRELEIAVLGNEAPEASSIGEIISGNEFYDYEAKYEDRGSVTEVARGIEPAKAREIRETAMRIYRVMECRGLARVDFFLREDGQVIFNELNTMPGFTSISMYPALWENDGLPCGQLIDRLIGLAMTEKEEKR